MRDFSFCSSHGKTVMRLGCGVMQLQWIIYFNQLQNTCEPYAAGGGGHQWSAFIYECSHHALRAVLTRMHSGLDSGTHSCTTSPPRPLLHVMLQLKSWDTEKCLHAITAEREKQNNFLKTDLYSKGGKKEKRKHFAPEFSFWRIGVWWYRISQNKKATQGKSVWL